MKDKLGRNIDYLRISVTDKCNLRCKYCMPAQGVTRIPHEELLTLEEVYRVAAVFEKLGIRKIRLTGGEPLVRKNIEWLVEKIHALSGIEEIGMTTNGVLFAEKAETLKKAGLTGVNISLDTLDRAIFESITGVDAYEKTKEAIEKALQTGLHVKINCVPCRELNENSLLQVAELAKDSPVDVRFIELMPIGCGKDFTGIASDELLQKLEQRFGKAESCEQKRGNGPARYVTFLGFSGKIGFISPLSHSFCSQCNRVRLTAEGQLKLCLHADKGIALKPLLRMGLSDEEIQKQIEASVYGKPKEHHFMEEQFQADKRKMFQIGG